MLNFYNIARFEGVGKDAYTIDGVSVSNHEYSTLYNKAIRMDSLYTIETKKGRFKHGASVYANE